MSPFIGKSTVAIVQGMGKEGTVAARNMRAYGTRVAAGIAPGRGGSDSDGIPLYESVADAIAVHPDIDTSFVCVPPGAVRAAATEAIENGIRTIVIVTENTPLHDTARIIASARERQATLIGPSSVGVIVPGIAKVGAIGGEDNRAFTPGDVAIISKSGGMCAETALLLTRAGIGQSFAIGIGGDELIGTTFADALRALERDERTSCIVIYGEIGGTYEEEAAAAIKDGLCTKPVIAFIAGAFASGLHGVSLGHAGAIVEGEQGTREAKREALREAGATVVEVHHEIVDAVRRVRGG